MNDSTLNKYNLAAQICGKVYKDIKNKIVEENILNVYELQMYGNNRITEEVKLTYKNCKNKGIASPVSLSLNDCVGNYIHEDTLDLYNNIRLGDVVKVDFSVSVDGCIASIGETFVYGNINNKHMEVLKFLDKLSSKIVKKIHSGEVNDEIRIYIESKCSDKNLFPVENCVSYQQFESHSKTSESNYIILNYKPVWDTNDTLVNEENLCFEFEEGDVYTINLTLVENRDDNKLREYTQYCKPHLYRFNDHQYSLKLKSSRTFFSKVKAEHQNYTFGISEYNKDPKNRMGIRECLENRLLESYPIHFTKDKSPVFSKKFTLVVKKDSSYLLKYNS